MISGVPLATYRLQFNADFRFEDAIQILDYVRDLGISHIYASPVLTSRRGSGHGYDVTDSTKIDAELGGDEGFSALRAALEERGMGLLLDIVPNHMAACSENRWWMDVLEYGSDSPYASYFDINWRPPIRSMENKILLPFLDRPFGEALNDGEFRVEYEEGRFLLRHGDQIFPLAPASYAEILGSGEGKDPIEPDSSAAHEWGGILAAAQAVAADTNFGAQAIAERRTKFERLRERLKELAASSPEIAALLARKLDLLNGTDLNIANYNDLERLLSLQHYRLAYWQTPSDTINYRRFFSITDLVGVRAEDPSVFDATHEAMIRLGSKGGTSGFRIDHIDGLLDPLAYLNRLQERLSAEGADSAGAFLLVEKILARNETLPLDWPVQGTTGYDYLNYANRLQVDEQQAQALLDVYSRWTESKVGFDEVLYQKKKLVMRTLLAIEIRSLGRQLAELARDDRYAREIPPADLAEVLVEVTASLPVYRTYIRTLDVPHFAQDILTEAIAVARTRRTSLPPACFDFLSDVLLLSAPGHVRPSQREARLAFVMRWQQFTGPIVAKGHEDTALYVYFPLSSLNEVGGDPRVMETRPQEFHEFIEQRQKRWPHSMNATTTHDTKRSEDARARIAVLSEIPEDWEAGLRAWSEANVNFTGKIEGQIVPDRNEEYLFYQTLIGAWPLEEENWTRFVERIESYLIKAMREAKVHTRWTPPNERYESALRKFIAGVLNRNRNMAFCSRFARFQERTALHGMLNSLGQTLLKIACPGVPDFYQGAELWDLRLVDPDNRGLIDFRKRASLLHCVRDGTSCKCQEQINELLLNWRDARVKLHVVREALSARRAHCDLFQNGDYRPLVVSGPHRTRVIAFARQSGDERLIVAIPRCLASLHAPVLDDDRSRFWRDTELNLPDDSPSIWTNKLAGRDAPHIERMERRLSLGDVFQGFPVALLLPAA